MSKKNKKNKKSKKFNPIFEMLMREEAAEKEDNAKEKQVKASKESSSAVVKEIQQVKAGTKSICTARKAAAEKVDVSTKQNVDKESNEDEKKKEGEAKETYKLSDTEAAKNMKAFFNIA